METVNAAKSLDHRIKPPAVVAYLLQLVIATAGAMFVGTLVTLIVAATLAALTKNASAGNFIDHVIDQPFFRWADKSAFVMVLCGFGLGSAARRFFAHRSAALVWIPPAIVLLLNLFTWTGYGPPTTTRYWMEAWSNYFADCGSSECLYWFLVTLPFYTSVAYSLGWFSGRLFRFNTTSGVRS